MDDDFDSSDLEFEPPPPDPFLDASSAVIAAIIEHAEEDRIASKKMSKQLTFAEGSKKTEYITKLWNARLVTYRTYALKKSTEITPTGEDIERFLFSIVSKVKPRRNDVPAYSWLQDGLRRLTARLTFQYRDFELSKHDSIRIKTVFQQMLNDGLITKEPSREKQWVGVLLVRRLITTLLREAFEEGTINWDLTIQKTLSILLISAFSCRSGDIMTAHGDTQDLPFLCYNDITIKLVGGKKLEHLQAQVIIRNEKFKKHNPADNRKVTLHSLLRNEDHIMCPIKMILVNAMRLGAVEDTTIQQIIKRMVGREDKTLKWTKGKEFSPVLCAFDTASPVVIPEKAAGVRQVYVTVRTTSSKACITAEIAPHDLRRGSARDIAHLNSPVVGVATPVVAAALGQSTRALEDGTTASYVGHTNDDLWTKRVEANFDDPFGVSVSEQTFKRPKLNRHELGLLYKQANVDKSDRKGTRKVREDYYAAEEKKRVENSQSFGDDLAPQQKLVKINRKPSALASRTPSQINQGTRTKRKADTLSEEISGPDSLGIGAELDERKVESQLLTSAENLVDVIGETEDVEPDEGTAEMILSQVENPIESNDAFTLPAAEFVAFFSQINVIRNEALVKTKGTDEAIPESYRGNSRAEPTFFDFHCQKTEGCPYTASSTHLIMVHESRCSAKLVASKMIEKLFLCPVDECPSRFATAHALKVHTADVHEWKPRPCVKPECDPEVLYNSSKELTKHRKTVHPAWTPKECPIEDCRTETEFKSAQALKTHLQTIHKITDSEVLREHTWVGKPRYLPQACTFPECMSGKIYPDKKSLVSHLQKRHKLDKEEALSYVTTK